MVTVSGYFYLTFNLLDSEKDYLFIYLFFFLFLPESRVDISFGDNSHKTSNPTLWEKSKKNIIQLVFCWFFAQRVQKVLMWIQYHKHWSRRQLWHWCDIDVSWTSILPNLHGYIIGKLISLWWLWPYFQCQHQWRNGGVFFFFFFFSESISGLSEY